jgi:hypothetical protein
MTAVIDEAARAAGRDPAAIRRLYNITGTFSARGTGFLDGPAATWAEQLAGLVIEQGMSAFLVTGDDAEVIRRFAGEVAPAVRELVAAERVTPAPPPATVDSPQTTVVIGQSSVPAALGVTPTPDDGTRRSSTRVWDESRRPTGPAPDPARVYSARERASGQHLVEVHDHLRQELTGIRQLVEQVGAGTLDVGSARSAINAMTLRQNNWTLGVYCESYCRLVTTHHTLEDIALFPRLRQGDPALTPVVDRLQYEHGIIHDVLEGVDRALVALVAEPDGMKAVREAVDLLTDTLLSHLSYEERELVEPLARLAIL